MTSRRSRPAPSSGNKKLPGESLGFFARVHAVVRKIPRGKVATYGDVAKAAGSPGAARQVVWALRQGTALPWHRVLGAKGWIRLGGEPGFEQQMRLRNEGVEISGRGRVDLEVYGAKLKGPRRR